MKMCALAKRVTILSLLVSVLLPVTAIPQPQSGTPSGNATEATKTDERIRKIEQSVEQLKTSADFAGLGNFADEATVLFGVAGLGLIILPLALGILGFIEIKGLEKSVETKITIEVQNRLGAIQSQLETQLDRKLALSSQENSLKITEIKNYSHQQAADLHDQQKKNIDEIHQQATTLRDQQKKALENYTDEVRSRIYGETSFVFGHFGRKGDKIIDKDLLEKAVTRLEIALKHPGDWEWTYKNNLVAYLAILEDPLSAPKALQLADQLKSRFQESESEGRHQLLDTYTLAVAKFSKLGVSEVRQRLADAIKLTEWLLESGKLPEEVDSLQERLKELRSMADPNHQA